MGVGEELAKPIKNNTEKTLSKQNNTKMELREISLKNLFPDQNQPRKNFEIETLAEAIQKNGIVPIEVVPEGNKYKIVDGERRFRACKKLNLETIPCLVTEKRDNTLERQLVLDFHKEHFNPVEKARALKKLKKLKNCSNRELSKELNISHTTINKLLNLTEAPKPFQDAVEKGMNYKIVSEIMNLPENERRKVSKMLAKKSEKFIKARIRKYGLSSKNQKNKILNSKGINFSEGVFLHNKNETTKHFLVKALLFKMLKERGRMAGTEVETTNSIADVLDATNLFVYEIETEAKPENRKEILDQYRDVNFIEDVFVIDLRKVPDNIFEMEKCLKENVV